MKEVLCFVVYDVVRQVVLENVIYIEICFVLEFFMDKGLIVSDIVFVVLEGLVDVQKEFNIVVCVFVCGMC